MSRNPEAQPAPSNVMGVNLAHPDKRTNLVDMNLNEPVGPDPRHRTWISTPVLQAPAGLRSRVATSPDAPTSTLRVLARADPLSSIRRRAERQLVSRHQMSLSGGFGPRGPDVNKDRWR